MKDSSKYEEVKVVLEEFQTMTWVVRWIDDTDRLHEYEFSTSTQAHDLYNQLDRTEFKYRSILRITRN